MDHDDPGADDVEFLDIGPTARGRRRGRRLLPLLIGGVLVAVGIVVVARSSGTPSASPSDRVPTQSPGSTATLRLGSGSSEVPPVVVTDLGHAILGVTKRWDLFGRGDGVVVRIQLALGRITRTTVPDLGSTGPVSFVVGADQAIVRPLDVVPGYVVPDGRSARQASARLGPSGTMFPGPDPNHVWLESEKSNAPAMTLVALDADHAGPTIGVPAGSSPVEGRPDGAGGVLFPGPHAAYDLRADGLHRISNGSVVATGRTGWLAVECPTVGRCVTIAINQATGHRKRVPTRVAVDERLGAIAPDGRTAAVFSGGSLYLLDLDSGGRREVRLSIGSDLTDASIAWAPDSRWLFVIDADGRLRAVDPRNGRTRDVGAGLPKLSQLAIRNLAS